MFSEEKGQRTIDAILWDYDIIDSHIHIFSSLKRCNDLNWLDPGHALYAPHSFADYKAVSPAVNSAIFVECDTKVDADLSAHFEEFRDAASNLGVHAIVAWAPMDSKERLIRYLASIEEIDDRHLLRGIRVLLQDKEDGYCLQPEFIECIQYLGTIGLLFEIGIDVHSRGVVQLMDAVSMIEQCPDTCFVLNHLAKPDLSRDVDPDYCRLMTRIATHHNTSMKLSGGLTELKSGDTLPHKQLANYIKLNLELFGSDRVLFGSDWPVLTLSVANVDKSPMSWLRYCNYTLDEYGVSKQEMQRIFAENSRQIYRLP